MLNVIPPDEYADHVNNSAYTNAGAILSLQYAAAVGELLGKPPAALAAWRDAASRIVVPFNATSGVHPEYDGYKLGTQIKQADVILLGFPFEFSSSPTFTPATRAADLNYYATVTDPGSVAMSERSGTEGAGGRKGAQGAE